MPQIKPGRYSDEPKGFLTYPILGEKDTTGLQSVLLTEKKNFCYSIQSSGKKIQTHKISKKISEALEGVGINVTKTNHLTSTGRRTLKVLKDGKVIDLPVEIRKVMKRLELLEIEIRVTGQNEEELIKNIGAIKNALSTWHIKPRQCVWSQGKWKEATATPEPVVKESEIEKEVRRLQAIVQSQAHDLAEIKEAGIKKAIRSDREVMKGILH